MAHALANTDPAHVSQRSLRYRSGRPLRLVTWNCRSGAVDTRLDDLSEYAPDIVFLQECDPAETLPLAGQVVRRRVNAAKGVALIVVNSAFRFTEAVGSAATVASIAGAV